MKFIRVVQAGAIAAAFAASGVAQADPVNLLINGSFEYPTVPNGTWVQDGSLSGNASFGWEYDPGQVVEIRNNAVGTAQDGYNYVELDSTNNMSIWQTIATTVGQAYEISFWYSPRIDQPASTNGINVYWGVTLLSDPTITGDGGSINDWVKYTYTAVATGITSTLKFSAEGASDSFGGNIDNVAISTVPLPGAALMFGSALLGAGVLRRRKQDENPGGLAA